MGRSHNEEMRILISAGEASGDMYGAQLIDALRCHDPSLEFFGVCGERMRAAGCETLVEASHLAVVGISEIVSHLPKIWSLFHRLLSASDRLRPDLAIVIDSPAFNWRLARQMAKRGVPVVYYVCPQFWAWRQGRVRLLRRYVRKALVIFPFEEKFYRDRGVDATFVGHPLASLARPELDREDYGAEYRLDCAKPWITLMPGSRVKEVRMNLPRMLESASKLGSSYEFLLPVAPTIPRSFLEPLLASEAGGSAPLVHLVPEALPALAHSRAGIIASGTATVEAAMQKTPFVMVYRVTGLTYFLGRRTVKVPHFAMVNLIAGKAVVRELIQSDFTPENVVRELYEILADGPAREEMLADFALVKARLRLDHQASSHPAARAAAAIMDLLPAARVEAKLS
jgi:lipid-A-disaccharide synthase